MIHPVIKEAALRICGVSLAKFDLMEGCWLQSASPKLHIVISTNLVGDRLVTVETEESTHHVVNEIKALLGDLVIKYWWSSSGRTTTTTFVLKPLYL